MKNKFLLILIILGLHLPLASSVFAQQWAESMFEERRHSFGNVAIGVEAIHRFKFKNPYPEDIRIASVTSSCGCTTPFWPKSAIKFGETGEVIAKLNTDGRFKEDKSATLTVVFDRPYRAEVQLQVTSYIRPDVVINPGVVDFGTVGEGKEVSKKLTLQYAGRSDWKLTKVERTNPHIFAKVTPASSRNGLVVYDIVVTMRDTMPSGYVHDMIRFTTNDTNPNASVIMLPVHGFVAAPLVAKPSPFVVGFVKPGETVKKNLVLRSDSESPFRITKITSQDPRFQFAVSNFEHYVHVLPIEFTADASLGSLSEPIIIHTTLPGQQKQLMLLTQGMVFDERQPDFPRQMIAGQSHQDETPEASENPSPFRMVEAGNANTASNIASMTAERQTSSDPPAGFVADADSTEKVAARFQINLTPKANSPPEAETRDVTVENAGISVFVADTAEVDEAVELPPSPAGMTGMIVNMTTPPAVSEMAAVPEMIVPEMTVPDHVPVLSATIPDQRPNVEQETNAGYRETAAAFRLHDDSQSPNRLPDTSQIAESGDTWEPLSNGEIVLDPPAPTASQNDVPPVIGTLAGIRPSEPAPLPDFEEPAAPAFEVPAFEVSAFEAVDTPPTDSEMRAIPLAPVPVVTPIEAPLTVGTSPVLQVMPQDASQNLVFSTPSVKDNLLLFSEPKQDTVDISDVFVIVDETPTRNRVNPTNVVPNVASNAVTGLQSPPRVTPVAPPFESTPRIAIATPAGERQTIPPVPGMRPSNLPLSNTPQSNTPQSVLPPLPGTPNDVKPLLSPAAADASYEPTDTRALITSLFGSSNDSDAEKSGFEHVSPVTNRQPSPLPLAQQDGLSQPDLAASELQPLELQPLVPENYNVWNGQMTQIPGTETEGETMVRDPMQGAVAGGAPIPMTLPQAPNPGRNVPQNVVPNPGVNRAGVPMPPVQQANNAVRQPNGSTGQQQPTRQQLQQQQQALARQQMLMQQQQQQQRQGISPQQQQQLMQQQMQQQRMAAAGQANRIAANTSTGTTAQQVQNRAVQQQGNAARPPQQIVLPPAPVMQNPSMMPAPAFR